MICCVGEAVYRGRTIPLEGVGAKLVARAVREGEATTDDGTSVTVTARAPHAIHERVGCIHPEMGLKTRTALAAAGRARGLSTPHDQRLARLRAELADCAIERPETTAERRAVAAATTETDRLRERVAETRGRLAARQDGGDETAAVQATFRDAARELSEAETEATAARQDLDRKRRETRAARDALDRRMALEDDLANCRRRARETLVERLRPAYERALVTVPGGPESVPTDPFGVDAVTAGLAVARVASLAAPVVLACDRFVDATAASAWLDAPVIRCR